MDPIFGTDGSDVIIGTSEADDIRVLGADDFVFSGDGDDTIFGGAGFDHLYGSRGNDYISGGSGADFIHGGTGNDNLWGGPASGPAGVRWVDTFYVGANTGVDTIWDWNRVDRINIDAPGIDAKSDLTLQAVTNGVRIKWGTDAAIRIIGDIAPADFVANDFLFIA